MLQTKLKFAVLAAAAGAVVFGQTQVDLRTQAKTIDFTQAPETRPIKTGTALPATCSLGDMFFLSTAVPGENLYACVAVSTWALQSGAGGGGGSVTVDSNSTVVGTRPINNYIAGPGIQSLLSDTGTQINIQFNPDTSILLSRAQEQAGSDVSLSCASGSSTAYACSPNGNALAVYTDQQRLAWKPDVSCGATPTINISGLGAVPLYRSDGSSIQAGDCAAGQQVTIWLDATANTLATTTGTASSGSTALTVASATGIAAGQWVYGAGIASGTTVSSISGTNVTLSIATTAALSSTSVSFVGGAFKLTAAAAGLGAFTFNAVSFSATPAFAFGSGEMTFEITLTGNVTGSTVSGATAGQGATFIICQDSTGSRTFTWPSGFKGTMTIGTTASKCNVQRFVYDGTSYYAMAAGVTNQ